MEGGYTEQRSLSLSARQGYSYFHGNSSAHIAQPNNFLLTPPHNQNTVWEHLDFLQARGFTVDVIAVLFEPQCQNALQNLYLLLPPSCDVASLFIDLQNNLMLTRSPMPYASSPPTLAGAGSWPQITPTPGSHQPRTTPHNLSSATNNVFHNWRATQSGGVNDSQLAVRTMPHTQVGNMQANPSLSQHTTGPAWGAPAGLQSPFSEAMSQDFYSPVQTPGFDHPVTTLQENSLAECGEQFNLVHAIATPEVHTLAPTEIATPQQAARTGTVQTSPPTAASQVGADSSPQTMSSPNKHPTQQSFKEWNPPDRTSRREETFSTWCPHCKKGFKNSRELGFHVEAKHDKQTKYSCRHCASRLTPFTTWRPSQLASHHTRFHSDECDLQQPERGTHARCRHEEHTPKPKRYWPCWLCPTLLKSHDEWLKHHTDGHSGSTPDQLDRNLSILNLLSQESLEQLWVEQVAKLWRHTGHSWTMKWSPSGKDKVRDALVTALETSSHNGHDLTAPIAQDSCLNLLEAVMAATEHYREKSIRHVDGPYPSHTLPTSQGMNTFDSQEHNNLF